MNTASTDLFMFARQKKQKVEITGLEVRISFNLKLFQNFFKNPIAAEEHGRKVDLAYGSSLEVVKIRYNLQTYLFFC